MSPDQQIVFDLVQSGIRGDVLAVRQTARRLLHRSATTPEVDLFSTALARLLDDPAPAPSDGRAQRPDPSGGELLHRRIDGSAPRPELNAPEAAVLNEIIAEHRAASALRRRGLAPTHSLILTGPPGVGKTMTARFLAASLGLPLLTLDLAGVISSLFGRTGQNLRGALETARSEPSVLLLDEFDALGKRREDVGDVGELRRIVNVLLLELDREVQHGMVIAATNHPALLDPAVWRRFDRSLALDLPTTETRNRILRRTLVELGHEPSPRPIELAARAMEGISGADVVRATREVVRGAIVAGDNEVELRLLSAAIRLLKSRVGHDRDARVLFSKIAVDELGWSHREVAEALGVSHTTVGRMLYRRAAEADGPVEDATRAHKSARVR